MDERSGIQPIPIDEIVPTRRMASLEADFQHLETLLGEPVWRGDDTFPGDDEHQRVFWRTRDAHSDAVLCVWDWDAPTATIAANTKWHVYWHDGSDASGSGRELYEQLQTALMQVEAGEPDEAYIAGVIPPKAQVDWSKREAAEQAARDERYGWSRREAVGESAFGASSRATAEAAAQASRARVEAEQARADAVNARREAEAEQRRTDRATRAAAHEAQKEAQRRSDPSAKLKEEMAAAAAALSRDAGSAAAHATSDAKQAVGAVADDVVEDVELMEVQPVEPPQFASSPQQSPRQSSQPKNPARPQKQQRAKVSVRDPREAFKLALDYRRRFQQKLTDARRQMAGRADTEKMRQQITKFATDAAISEISSETGIPASEIASIISRYQRQA